MKFNSKTLSAAVALSAAFALAACSPAHENDSDSDYIDTATTGASSPELADQTTKAPGAAEEASDSEATETVEVLEGSEQGLGTAGGSGVAEPAVAAQ